MNVISHHTGLKGQYRYERKQAGILVESTPWRDNIILNQGLDFFASTSIGFFLGFCSVSSDTGVPAETDTSFGSITATDTTVNTCTRTNVGAPTYATEIVTSYMFPVGTFSSTGVYIRQFGVGRGTTLFSKHRLVDSAGVPTELGVDNLTELTVYYKLIVTPTVVDITGSVLGSDYIGRISGVSTFMGAPSTALTAPPCFGVSMNYVSGGPITVYPSTSVLGPVTGVPTGTGLLVSGTSLTQEVVPTSYVPGTFARQNKVTIVPSAGNASGGIGALVMRNTAVNSATYTQCAHQYQFTPPLAKDATKTLSLTFAYTWGRTT